MMCVVETFKKDPLAVENTSYSGDGIFSEVYVTECNQYAVKHCNYAFADAWLLYAVKLMSMEIQPEWAPKIHALWIDFKTGAYSALVEALYDTSYGPESGGYIEELMYTYREMDAGDRDCPAWAEDFKRFELEQLDREFPESRECVELLQEISNASELRLFYDVPGNCMENSEGVLIYNDPVCIAGWRGAKRDRNQAGPKIEQYIRSILSENNVANITIVE